MLGVVLWSDSLDKKAVIWCEDQGDLAYFNGGEDAPLDLADLDAGDLVSFELQQECHLRYAKNPQRIGQGAYEGLAEQLRDTTRPRQPNEMDTRPRKFMGSADVIPFCRGTIERADRELVAV
ncbi:hypothetical protein SAMN05444000_11567 [Shimia gijangensis]|uniref:Uncharacterized protein n=1 Tax=Shimia gijangensis TaxID=1470563 RepID=A0A1M6N7L1_9RHOB|nr:hypothetical protein [Shimia gijangensis]SHJ91536.1 hypothetical protein SAMN05444000_11567 [Shimia gijangensis]